MVSGRLIKLVVFELLEFAAFSVPTLVIMEQFATAYHSKRNASEKTHYWLIVSCSIAYVASVTLLIWVPVKVLLHKKHHLHKKIKGWRPVMMMCVVLTTLPSFSFSIAVAEVQKNINGTDDNSPDPLPDLSVSLVLTCLIVVDIIEKIRVYPLRGSQKIKRIHDLAIVEFLFWAICGSRIEFSCSTQEILAPFLANAPHTYLHLFVIESLSIAVLLNTFQWSFQMKMDQEERPGNLLWKISQ